MSRFLMAGFAILVVGTGLLGCHAVASAQQATSEESASAERQTLTEIDRYVRRPDSSYRWRVVSSKTSDGMTEVVVDMVSQSWRSDDEVNRTKWQHWITFAIPADLRSETALLMIGGGSNKGKAPAGPSDRIKRIARATGSVVCELRMVPNQPLEFHQDGQSRTEDDLIGYTWDQYLKTGEADWLARGPMVKSVVRAMDTTTALMASELGGHKRVNRFVVAGASKRGWTTWLTGAMDDRVVAIIPIVIDVLNVDPSMRHHFAAYGFWAPSVGDYVRHRIMQRMNHPRLRQIYRLVDPYSYRERLTIPKYILNASGDQFFLPDSSQFYFDDLPGPKYLRYVPNADHGMDGTDALESVLAFYGLILADRRPPEMEWIVQPDGAFRITTEQRPSQVLLWQATNPDHRDFRVETMGRFFKSTSVTANDKGVYVANVPDPKRGWTAYFVELTYDVGMPVPLKLTTSVRVVPDTLPYAEKPLAEPFTVTIRCQAPSETSAQQTQAAVDGLVESGAIAAHDWQSEVDGTTCYFNWRPAEGKSRAQAASLTEFLQSRSCTKIQYQLESGSNITR